MLRSHWFNSKIRFKIFRFWGLYARIAQQATLAPIPETAEIGPELADCLRKKGIDFYADFELKRSIAYFNNAYKKEQILSVYLHKKSRSLEAGFIN